MKREIRYLVFKWKDIEAAPREIQELLKGCAEVISDQRKKAGKPPLECVVVESDWPEYEPTWRAIEARVDQTDKREG